MRFAQWLSYDGNMQESYPTCDELVGTLGDSVVRMVASDGSAYSVRQVAIYDPDESVSPGTLSLAPNVTEADLRALRRAGGRMVVCRGPIADSLLRAGAGMAVLELAAGVSWTDFVDDVRRVVTAWSATSAPAPPPDDLFTSLNAAAILVDASLVLEDPKLAVLAWSDRQDEADDERVTGILGRRAPSWLVSTLRERGTFARLAASDTPLFLEPASSTAKPRMATSVRLDGRLFGYLWATADEPFDPDRSRDFSQIAHAIARILSTGGDPLPTRKSDLLAALLRGGDITGPAAGLGVATSKLTIIATRTPAAARADDTWSDRRKVLEPLTLHLAISHTLATATFVDGTTYAVLPWPPSTSDAEALARTRKIAEAFHRRAAQNDEIVLALGGVSDGADEIVAAKEEADLVLRTLLKHRTMPSIASFADIQVAFVLSEVAGSLRRAGTLLEGPVDQLDRHDRLHRTDLLPTLTAYLDSFGDVAAASSHLHIHPNTFRNRLRRITELTGFDAADADARFLAELQLRLRCLHMGTW